MHPKQHVIYDNTSKPEPGSLSTRKHRQSPLLHGLSASEDRHDNNNLSTFHTYVFLSGKHTRESINTSSIIVITLAGGRKTEGSDLGEIVRAKK